MAIAKKKVAKKVVEETPAIKHVATSTKTERHIVKDGEVILDPKYSNHGVFSQA